MRQKAPRELRPNCLLTRYPVCFMHGLKSLFNFHDYWHGIPEFLAQHGYEVHEFLAPWRGPNKRRVESFGDQINRVAKTSKKVHLLGHSLGCLNAMEIASLLDFKDRIASITLVSPPFGGTPWAKLGLIGRVGGMGLFASTNETLTAEGARTLVSQFKVPQDVLVGSILSLGKISPHSYAIAAQNKILTWYLKRRSLPSENDGLVPLASQRIAETFGPVFSEFPGDHMQVIGGMPWPPHLRTAHELYLDHCIFLAEYDLKNAK